MKLTMQKAVRYLRQPDSRKLWGALRGPRVVLASVPKTGTNLVSRTLRLFPQLRSIGSAVGAADQKAEMRERIAKVGRGEFITTHYPLPDILDLVDQHGLRGVFVLRDPRDTCVSWYHYIMKESAHWCHRYFREGLEDPASRLMAAITGLEPNSETGRPYLASIDGHFRTRLDYLEDRRFLTVRFEDVVGSRGGGDDMRQREAIFRVAEHLGLKLRQGDVSNIVGHAFGEDSPTFRKGQIGSWREEMLPEHKTAFKAITGSLLIDLGYEADLDW